MPPGVCESSQAATIDHVLAPAFLGHLGRMRLAVRRAFGPRPGDTPVRNMVQPIGLELERHKPYDQGDELRFLDWNAYARLDQLLVRQFRAEREAPVHIFLDGSASMTMPEADGKFAFSVGLALALAYVSIRHHNPTRIVFLTSTSGGYTPSTTVRFPARLPFLSEFCAHLRASGDTTLDGGINAYLQSTVGPGFAILISDFLVEPATSRRVLQRLAAGGYETAALRPIGPGERDPSTLFQQARVRDVESGKERIVRLTPENLAHYHTALREHLDSLERDCADNQALYATCEVNAGLEQCLFSQLPQLGLLR